MTLEKDGKIIMLLSRLQIAQHGLEVIDHWEADQCAIGVRSSQSPGRLVYISVFNKPKGLYDFECEVENSAANLGYDVVDAGRSVPFDILVAAIERHFTPNL